MLKGMSLIASLTVICFVFSGCAKKPPLPGELTTGEQVMGYLGKGMSQIETMSDDTVMTEVNAAGETVRTLRAKCKSASVEGVMNMSAEARSPDGLDQMRLLVRRYPDKEDNVLLWLPDVGVKSIPVKDRSTDLIKLPGFDVNLWLALSKPNDYEYKLLGVKPLEDGSVCYVVDSTRKSGKEEGYPRARTWVWKNHPVILQMEIYNEAGKLQKTLRNTDVKLVDREKDIWWPHKGTISVEGKDHRTIITINRTIVNQPISDHLLTEDWLKTGEE